MITAEEALERTIKCRKEIADRFMEEHPDVIGKIEALINKNKDATQVYYPNDGELSVKTFELGITLMELGYGVRKAIPCAEYSGIDIRWSRDMWAPDRTEFSWK